MLSKNCQGCSTNTFNPRGTDLEIQDTAHQLTVTQMSIDGETCGGETMKGTAVAVDWLLLGHFWVGCSLPVAVGSFLFGRSSVVRVQMLCVTVQRQGNRTGSRCRISLLTKRFHEEGKKQMCANSET